MTAPCPHCGAPYDLTHRIGGDRVWCSCGGWFLIRFVGADAVLIKCDAPVTWPKARRAKQGP